MRGGWKGTVYSLHPGFAMETSSMANLVKKTGKTFEEWIEIVERDGPPDNKSRREWLKNEHGFTTNYAMWVADRADGVGGADAYDPAKSVEGMFQGKENLRPIYEALLQEAFELGEDVMVCPCDTIVPFFRKHVFAQVKPTTKTRIDLGLALRDLPAEGSLIDTGGYAKKDRITHRIALSSTADITPEVLAWLRKAYEMNPA